MRLLLVFCFSLLLIGPGQAQERVRNVRVRVIDAERLEILYDLLTARPGDSVYVAVYSRTRGELRMLPEYVRGDVGVRITAGSDRRVIWEAVANGYLLDEEVQAKVFLKTGTSTGVGQQTLAPAPVAAEPVEPANPGMAAGDDSNALPKKRYSGPAWALLSALAPGIGNIFVQTPRPKIGLRPLLTLGCYALMAYGLPERQKAQDNYDLYLEQKNRTAAEPYYQAANSQHHRYYLTTRGVMIVAAADVILTFIRGVSNTRARRESPRLTMRPGLLAGQPTMVMRYGL